MIAPFYRMEFDNCQGRLRFCLPERGCDRPAKRGENRCMKMEMAAMGVGRRRCKAIDLDKEFQFCIYGKELSDSREISMTSSEKKQIQVKSDRMDAAGVSDPGRMRSQNEDSIFIDEAGAFVRLSGSQAF